MKTVTVKFDNYSGKTYDYLVDNNTEVQVGNYAVTHNGGAQFAIVQVVEVSAGVSAKANKSLVLVFNDTIMNEYLERNQKVLEQKALFTRLVDQLIDQEYENNKYRVLAASNAEAAEILAKLGIK
jgi:hypothetical protein